MISKGDKIAFAIITLSIILMVVFWKDVKALLGSKTAVSQIDTKKDKKDKENKENTEEKEDKEEKKKDKKDDIKINSEITISQKWDLPSGLKEISGIAYISDNRFACVQDELGKIFIFNTSLNNLEKEIPFGGPGDYEGIAIVGSTAYVIRADGKLFEVIGYDNTKPSVVQHSTTLTAKHDVEGLCYDQKNNRLLLAIKGKEESSDDYKGIYAFDLSSKKFVTTPVYKVDLTSNIWAEVKGKNKIQPSDLDVHPTTGDIYIIEGTSPKLLVMGADGTSKNLYQLNTSEFPQPEGIAFTKTGELFISNEGGKGSGTIVKVSIN